MQSVCNKFVMDMTDTRMGPEQKCRNCQFMKKEHTQSNSQQLPSNQNKVSDLMKKFSGPNNQVQEKFQGAVKSSVQQKKLEEKIPPQIQVSQTTNQSDQSNVSIRKIESQTISNESSSQTEQNKNQIQLEKQQSNTSKLDDINQIQQPPKQQVQIETAPFQTKLANNPFLKNDKQSQNQVAFSKPSVQNKIPGDEQKQQQTIQNKFQQQNEQKKNVVSEDQNQRSNFQEIKNAFAKQSPLVQEDSTTGYKQSSNKQQQIGNNFQGRPMNMPIIGFGPPPVKKISNQQEPESSLEQQMIERPFIQQKKNKRTIEEFSDLN
ncbi:unnamed protein product [Paramecium primaurelia]|uniref:Uncharacterized protein n=1 Tax=Paramecium primaurelia TaxID=5886 RepID=A0A8S1K3T1_PARPR|nr:unnamed protein product [Paramecium primaurelia]